VFTGDPVFVGGSLQAETTDYLNQPDMSSAYSGSRTWVMRYKAEVDGGTSTTWLMRGAADGSGDDGLALFLDWSSASALRFRARDVAGAGIVAVNWAWKPTVGTSYFIAIVFDIAGTGDVWARVFEAGNATPVFSSAGTAIGAGQSWTSSTNIGVDEAAADPANNAKIRDVRFHNEATGDANLGLIADGTGYTTNLVWRLLSVDEEKSESTFNRGNYLVDYTTLREDAQLRPDSVVDDGAHSPLWIYDFGYVTRQILEKLVAAGVEPTVVSE